MKATKLLLLLLSATMLAKAQDSTSTHKQTSLFPDLEVKTTTVTNLKQKEHPFAIAFAGGTQGGVFELKYGLRPKLALRAGGSIIPINDISNVTTFPNFNNENYTSINLSNAHLLIDYAPFKGKGFRLVGGAAYFYQGDATIDIQAKGGYFYGDIPLTSEAVGTTQLNILWQGIAPYAGIGLFKCIPKRFFNINLELGTYYLPKPIGTITGTGLLQGNTSNQEKFQENISDYRWLPVLQLNFTLKF
jgi:hypothetical protein